MAIQNPSWPVYSCRAGRAGGKRNLYCIVDGVQTLQCIMAANSGMKWSCCLQFGLVVQRRHLYGAL